MDRRQQRTRNAIFTAFSALLSEKSYSQITIQDIIDRADIGRSTFYSHFPTKDALVEEMCTHLFSHIIEAVTAGDLPSDRHNGDAPDPVFCHILQHIQEDRHLCDLLLSDSSEIFLKYFKSRLSRLIDSYVLKSSSRTDVPHDFLLNHITSAFVDMVQWWVKGQRKETPEELDRYFRAVIDPIV